MIHWPEIVPEKLRASVCGGLHAGKVTLYARKWSVSPEVAGPAIVHQEAGHGLMGGGKLALAVVGGYLLGRTKKMKLAIMLGGALAGKKISTDPAALLGQVTKLVSASPELQRLDSAVRGRLLEAGKDAALAVASSRMEALTDSLVDRVENLGKPAAGATKAAGEAAGAAGDTVTQAGGAAGDAASATAGAAKDTVRGERLEQFS